MRNFFLLVTALFVGSFVLSAAPRDAGAGPLPAISAPTAPGIVAAVDYTRRYWRRYCRDNGCDPDDMIAASPVVAPRVVDEVIVTPDGGTVVVVPLRPRSCGQYRYWNGSTCIDARYNTPYIGPVD
jgi:hypothetical protein